MLKLYQLALYFIKNFNYKIVEVKQLKNEIWLCNKKHRTYPIIRLTLNDLPENAQQIHIKEMILSSIVATVNCKQAYLDIHIGKENGDIADNVVAIDESYYAGVDVSRYFPDLKKQIKPVNNIEQEMQRIHGEFNEMAKKNQRKAKYLKYKDLPWVTIVTSLLCIIVYLCSFYFYRYDLNSSEVAIAMGGYYKIFIEAGQWFRMFTSGFVHVEFTHLMVNIISLLSLGRILEKYYGHARYAIIMFASILGGSLAMFALADNMVAVGLSGGLYGLIGALVIYIYSTKIYKIPMVMANLVYILLINIMINFLPNVGYLAHMGGFICGLLLAVIFSNNPAWKTLKQNTIVCAIILLVAVGYKCYDNWFINDIYGQSDLKILKIYEEAGLNVDKLTVNLIKIYQGEQG
ncbi:MAG: rhomboid family intramembrane serine protease [Erysipelotrichaceae bacterium]|nr:rhomboid family intramembrane serine protease [Erysipelotrichaceae bacterium]MDY5252342.1 rhomboid family intramembrane serine protease [Erysipelotrichaceae bacterium]